jgi:type 1 fimbria pilin
LAPSDDSPLVGERVTWTATAADCGATPVYQFSAAAHGGPFHVVRDFSPTNAFAWTPMQEGGYDVRVTVKDGYPAATTTSATASAAVASRLVGAQAVITPTLNPLVALYSVPPSSADSVFVQFAAAGTNPSWRNTNTLDVVPGKSTNVFVAGMLPSTSYQMRHVFSDGTGSAPLLFTTGALPSTLTFPTFTVGQPPSPGSSLDQDLVFHSLFVGPDPSSNVHPIATDVSGRVSWYFDAQQSGLGIGNMLTATLLPGGTVIGMGNDASSVRNNRNVLREIDLAGNPVRETNLAAMNAQLAALGQDTIYGFHHDVRRLPDGSLVVLGYPERAVSVNGVATQYIGEMLIVLDQDFRVVWTWNAFDHLDVNRGPVLGEVTQPGVGPTAVVPILPAVDWLHVNSVAWSPADGNLILSVRHQDWVIKIDYRNGTGDGHVVWRLGQGGDFAVNATDANPWFSHQHDAHYLDDTTLVLFDNGNTLWETDPNTHSRGQVWALDEQTMTATLVVNADLGSYSGALGAAQRLANGNYSFTLGTNGQPPPVRPPAHTVEVTASGVKVHDLQVNKPEYRSYRTRTLYQGTGDALAGAPRKVASVVVNDGAAQRSMVKRITVAFDGAAVLDPGAIELRRQNGALVNFQMAISAVGGKTVAVVTFAGPEFVGGSLADGNYALTVRADRVHDHWGRELDGDGNGLAGGDRTDALFRLYGDTDGDRDVDVPDLLRFLSSFRHRRGDPRFLDYLDFDGDDRVWIVDLQAFVRRLGTRLGP